MWTLLENLRSDVDTVFVSKHYYGFSVQTKQKIELSMYYSEFYYQPIYHSILNFPLEHLYNTTDYQTDYICFVLLSPIQLCS